MKSVRIRGPEALETLDTLYYARIFFSFCAKFDTVRGVVFLGNRSMQIVVFELEFQALSYTHDHLVVNLVSF